MVLYLYKVIRELVTLIPGTGDALHAPFFKNDRGVTFRAFTGV